MSLAATVAEKANLIWAIADKLTGAFKPHQYGEVILPLTVIRRFDSVLEPTKPAVLAAFKEHEDTPLLDAALRAATGGLSFYNTSPFTFTRLLDAPAGLVPNFRAYCDAFSPNVRRILDKFKPFWPHLATMAEKDILYLVLKEYTTSKADLHPDKVSNLEMGYIFEELIRRFSEAHNEDAGQHYTPREVIELMVNLLFAHDDAAPADGNATTTIYDPACGTGGMLSVAEEHIHKRNSRAGLILCGQELNDETFAVCQADMLIKGNEADFIKNGNTLSDDRFFGQTFDYILSNPPFGREWKNEKAAVEAEAARADGRFFAGLPSISDSQMLFLQTAVAHLKPTGRAAIIQNGSPLFTGDAGSGPSEIRRHILENDYLDAIIALPNDIFYNTGIATYIWLLCKSKPAARRGRVQLINAADLYEKRRKSLGNKRNDIPPAAIEEICRLYTDFAESPRSKIFDVADFGYTKITIERPADPAAADPASASADADATPAAADAPKKRGRKPGKRKADAARRDTENVPLRENIEDYFAREVLPFAPDAWIDHSKSKVGYEIPFTRYFYQYTPPRPAAELAVEIHDLELRLADSLAALFAEER
ncbi:class I SAM-dependent DNA methyltransferase [uncultured Desulfovibrio sp.]|uniref:type I restriction-modification system subunit M n=1 Tax=uncultured Desulfovibrio sp. TaxID=167968 RepID=UPI00260FBB5D|nr:class I SAM-dependent DNA methyltransferase [uncultured Desulfovibrio sp.]